MAGARRDLAWVNRPPPLSGGVIRGGHAPLDRDPPLPFAEGALGIHIVCGDEWFVPPEQAGPAQLLALNRNHWGIEN